MKIQEIYTGISMEPREDDIRTALDIGCGEGRMSNYLAQHGVEVTAIDKEQSSALDSNVHFEQVAFEEYQPNGVFDLVHARNVLPFFDNKPEQLSRMLLMGKYVFFTFFGPEDPWSSLGRTVSNDEMLPVLQDVEIIYSSEERFTGKTMSGKMKPWHTFTYLVRTKNE